MNCFKHQKDTWIMTQWLLGWERFHSLTSVNKEKVLKPRIVSLKAHHIIDITNELTQNNVLTVCLPANSSHFFQVLDLSIFSPKKLYYLNAKSKLFQNRIMKWQKRLKKHKLVLPCNIYGKHLLRMEWIWCHT